MDRRRIFELFDRAAELPEEARASWLASACNGDTATRAEVERLLRADARAERFMERPPATVARVIEEVVEAKPEQFGPYRVLRRIGIGGMGEVWLAERSDGEFEQRVAIKQLAYPTPGLLQRFRQERQILARLEHPNIARLIDGGVAADGAPYLAMEFVEGVPITEFARERALDVPAVLRLLLRVCEAVQFAHQNLVVHRDLKPSNIFVTADGSPKLLDFGIAKVLSTTDVDAPTQTIARMLTPDYAAPEQFTGAAVTTATDVYALGVVLYELLARQRPPRRSPAAAGDPPPPSVTVDRATRGTAARRRELRGDLDRITLTALAHNPARRYASADALASDIRRYLDGRPIAARGDRFGYRIAKFARRHRYALAAAMIVFAIFVAATLISLRQAREARAQAQRAEAVQAFLTDIFRANSSSQDNPVAARETSARALLDLGSKKIQASMDMAPEAKLGVLRVMSEMYDDLAMDDAAVALRRQAVAIARDLYGADSEQVAGELVQLAGSLHASSSVAEREQTLAEAEGVLDRRGDTTSLARGALLRKQSEHFGSVDLPRALDYARRAVAVYSLHGESGELAEALYGQGLGEENSGLFREAAKTFAHAIEVSREADGDPNPALPRLYAYLGEVDFRLLDIAGAETSQRRALATAIAVNGAEHVDTLQTKMRLGRLLFDTGRTREGLALLDEAKQLAIRIRGADDSFHVPQARRELGFSLMRAGALGEGLDEMNAALENRRRNRPGTRYLAIMLEGVADAEIERGRIGAARAALDEAAAIYAKVGVAERTSPYNASVAARIHAELADGRTTEASALLPRYFVEIAPPEGISLTETEYRLLSAEVALAAGDYAQASALARNVRESIAASGIGAYLKLPLARAELIDGVALLRSSDAPAALGPLTNARTIRGDLLLPQSPKLAEAVAARAECLARLGRMDEAATELAVARDIGSRQAELAKPYRASIALAETAVQETPARAEARR
jgi:eukaryotic-like serine/threonine-protein kinase